MPNFDAGTIESQLTLDRSPFTKGLELARAQYRRFKSDYGHLNIEVDLDAAEAEARLGLLAAEADRLDGRKVKLGVDSTTSRSIRDAEQHAGGLLTAILGLGPALIPIAGVAAGVLPSLAVGLGGAAAGGGALYLAFSQLDKTLAGQRLQREFHGITSELSGLRAEAQAGILPGAEAGLQGLVSLLPIITRAVTGSSRALGTLFIEGGQALQAPFWHQFFDYLGRTAVPFLLGAGHALGNISTGFAAMVQAFAPVNSQVGGGLLSLTARFAAFATTSGSFNKFVQYVVTEGPAVAHALGQILLVAGALLQALAPYGGVVLAIVAGFSQFLALPILRLFNDLPGPIRATAAALLVLLLMKSRLDAMGTSLGNFRTKLTSLGSGAAGARAGVSGLLGLVGGPWVAGLTIATGVLGYFISKHQEGKQRVQEFTDAIKADSGALGDNTRQTAVNALQKAGLFDKARNLGVSFKDLTDAALGFSPAVSSVNQYLDAYQQRLAAGVRNGTIAAHTAYEQGQQIQNLRTALGDTNSELSTAQRKYQDQQEALGTLSTATSGATTAIDQQNTSLKALQDTMTLATGQTLDLRQANRDVQAAFDALGQSLKQNGTSLDINTQKGRDNQAAFDATVKAITDRITAARNSHRSDELVNATLTKQRDRLIEVATKFLGSKQKAKEYVDQLLKIPPKVSTEIDLNTKRAIQQLGVLQGLLNKLKTIDLPNAPGNQGPPKAGGGWITGPGGPRSDSILTPTSRDEFVLQASAARSIDQQIDLRKLNRLGPGAGAALAGAGGGGGVQVVYPDSMIVEIGGEQFEAKVKRVVTKGDNRRAKDLRAGRKT